MNPAIQLPYTGQSGFSSLTSRFTYCSVGTASFFDNTNRYTNSRLCCPAYLAGEKVRVVYTLNFPGTTTPVQGENASDGATIWCGFETADGSIITLAPVLGTPGSDGISIVGVGGQTIAFEGYAPVGFADFPFVRTFADKGVGNDTNKLPLNINLSNYTTQTAPNAMDSWGDGANNTSTNCVTAGGTVTPVAGGTGTATFGPCAVGIVPAFPNSTACITFIGVGDSTKRGQSLSSAWQGGWSGIEAIYHTRPYINLAVPGEASTLTNDVTSAATTTKFANRLIIAGMFGKVAHVAYGWNDLLNSGTSAKVLANKKILGKFLADAGMCVISEDLWPSATSTDNWSSVANETVPSYYSIWNIIIGGVAVQGAVAPFSGSMSIAGYLTANNSSGAVPGPVGGQIILASGKVSSVNVGALRITPKANDGTASAVTMGGVTTALATTDPATNEYGNVSGGTVMVMTSGSGVGDYFPISGNTAVYTQVTDPGASIGAIAANDTFNIVLQLSQNPHLPSRQQVLLGGLSIMHKNVGLA